MRPFFVRLPAGLVVAVALVVACSEDPVSPLSRVRYVAVDVVPDTLLPGDTVRLAAQLLDADSNEVVATPAWSSSAPSIASVNQVGHVTALGPGTAFIIAAAGQGADSVEVIVGQPPVVQLSGKDSLVFGDTSTLTLSATGRGGAAALATQITWSSTDTGVIAVDSAGQVRATGYGSAKIIARLGTVADTHQVRGWLRYVESPAPLNSVSMGWGVHFCGIGADGGAFCWGSSVDGQLGLGVGVSAAAPTRVGGGVYTEVIAGDHGTCAVDASYALWCWGRNQYRQLAPDTLTGARIYTPRRVLTDLLFEHVFVSQHGQVCATTTDDVPYCWGHNDVYQVGRAPIAARDTIIAVVSGGLSMTYIRGSGFSTCGLDTAGAAWCWGYSDILPSSTSTPTPLKVSNGPFRDLTVAINAACAISSADEGFCWGYDVDGSLGNGDTSSAKVTTPRPIAGGHAWRAIAIAEEGGCGVTTAGQLMCWGQRKFSASQLDVTRPRAIAPSLSFKAVATVWLQGAFCALTSDGLRVYCF